MTYPFRYLARAVIEFLTPFHIGTGREGVVSDTEVVTDANGLPAVPGTSLAGALRAAFAAEHGKDKADQVFGYQRRNSGLGSRLSVSWACILDSKGNPVEGVVPSARLDDEVLQAALGVSVRDHVRITHRGVADAEGRGKFDTSLVCAGHRFVFELELVGTAEDEAVWNALLDLLSDPGLRLGAKTRSGAGAFKVVSLLTGTFDLTKPDQLDLYLKHPVRLGQATSSLKPKDPSKRSGRYKTAVLPIEPEGYWFFGGGQDLADEKTHLGHPADMAPVRDRRVVWQNNQGKVEENLAVIPGSAVKGALRHRTAYHYNRLTGRFADSASADQIARWAAEENKAVADLFGEIKDSKDSGKSSGRRGRVLIDDLFLSKEPTSQVVHHVSIDHFTGGARASFLFAEKPFHKGDPFGEGLAILVEDWDRLDGTVRQAFEAALQDLCEGRLALGAGTGRGHGFFRLKNNRRIEWR